MLYKTSNLPILWWKRNKYIGIKITIVHYLPYCSKWNPIEHRLFSQMHRQAQGCIFTSYQQVQQIWEQTSTDTGLKVFVRINPKQYQTKMGITKEDIDQKRILLHEKLPQFNYIFLPWIMAQLILNVSLRIDENDYFGLLLAVVMFDTIDAVTVKKIPP